jgi:hypothetical protein
MEIQPGIKERKPFKINGMLSILADLCILLFSPIEGALARDCTSGEFHINKYVD